MNDSATLAAPLHLTCAGFGRNAPLPVARFIIFMKRATGSCAFRPRH
jgi:hypothetical protein